MHDLAEAQRLLENGQIAEAERAFRGALDADPRSVEALKGLGLAVLSAGDPERAVELLAEAARAAPSDAALQLQLGRAHELCADMPAAMEAYATAVRLDPDLFTARLHLAGSLERLRRGDEAVIQYKRALDDAQRRGEWLDRATTPALLRPRIEHAVAHVKRHQRAAFERLLAPLRERFGRDSLSRVDRCVRILMQEEPPAYPDPRQQPTFLFFPDLPTSPYFPRSLLPWIDSLEAATPVVLAELERLLPSAKGRERVLVSDEQEASLLRGLDEPPSWNGYYFYRHGIRREDNCLACPATAAALEALPLCRVREHGPEVMFSVLTAGTHLTSHRGVTNTRSVCHLPLIVPESCALRVGGEIHEWVPGRVVAFDDTYEHEAWNRSRSTRVVLIFDIWNPYLTEAERAALGALVGAIGDLRGAVERA